MAMKKFTAGDHCYASHHKESEAVPILEGWMADIGAPKPPSRLSGTREGMHSPFFGAEIQPKHLVFCYLGFLPGFSLVFCCLPHPCTVLSKKTKLSCFGGFFSLVFKIQATAWFSWSCLHAAIRANGNVTYYLYLFKVVHSKKDI